MATATLSAGMMARRRSIGGSGGRKRREEGEGVEGGGGRVGGESGGEWAEEGCEVVLLGDGLWWGEGLFFCLVWWCVFFQSVTSMR